MQALDYAAAHAHSLAARYATLAHDFGKARSPAAEWPRHRAHEHASARLAERISERLRVPADCRDAARLAARFHGVVHRAAELRPSTILDLIGAADALRRPERFDTLLAACEADACSRPGAPAPYAPASLLREALAAVREVDAGAIAREAADKKHQAGAIGARIRAARLAALKRWKRARARTG
jgi:tRNA nucleotidyltransferase (CCA-adding enzyme)